jgi:drug/metabolite transporter (DMT)-like permease
MPAKNWLNLILLALLWGSSFVFIEVALTGFDPLTLVLLRLALAALILFAVVLAQGLAIPRHPRTWGAYLCMGLLTNVLPFSLIAWGQQHITAGTASILNATVPLFVVFATWRFGTGESLRRNQFVGIFLGFTGVLILMGPGLWREFTLQRAGELCILGAAVCYAAGSIFGKRFKDTPPVVNAAAMCACSALMLLPLTFAVAQPLETQADPKAWLALVAIAVLSTALAFLLYFSILRAAGPTFLSLVTYLIPIVAISLGALFLHEKVTLTNLLGVLVIFLALLILDGRAKRLIFARLHRPPPPS